MRRKSAARARRPSSAMAPASSTPVGLPPTITKVGSRLGAVRSSPHPVLQRPFRQNQFYWNAAQHR